MATRVKWKYPDREVDYGVHFLLSNEWTLCGLAFEGHGNERRDGILQDFVATTKKVDCGECIKRVKFCKSIKDYEYW